MCFKFRFVLLIFMFIWVPMLTLLADQPRKESQLFAVPNKCIALREGRTCFARISLSWQAEKTGNYCIKRVSDQLILNCWQLAQSGRLEYEFQSEMMERFELIERHNDRVLAGAKILIRWVYKSKQKHGQWRPF